MIRALSTIDTAAIVGVADDYPPHLEQGLKYAGPQAQGFADYRQMLERAQAGGRGGGRAAGHLHFPIATAVLEAGCDLFLEKTMCRTLDEARQLAQRVKHRAGCFRSACSGGPIRSICKRRR